MARQSSRSGLCIIQRFSQARVGFPRMFALRCSPHPAEAPIRNPDARAVPMYYLSRSRRLRPIDSRQKSEIALAIVFSSCNATGLIR